MELRLSLKLDQRNADRWPLTGTIKLQDTEGAGNCDCSFTFAKPGQLTVIKYPIGKAPVRVLTEVRRDDPTLNHGERLLFGMIILALNALTEHNLQALNEGSAANIFERVPTEGDQPSVELEKKDYFNKLLA